mgnify:CR=1 FL=1
MLRVYTRSFWCISKLFVKFSKRYKCLSLPEVKSNKVLSNVATKMWFFKLSHFNERTTNILCWFFYWIRLNQQSWRSEKAVPVRYHWPFEKITKLNFIRYFMQIFLLFKNGNLTLKWQQPCQFNTEHYIGILYIKIYFNTYNIPKHNF